MKLPANLSIKKLLDKEPKIKGSDKEDCHLITINRGGKAVIVVAESSK